MDTKLAFWKSLPRLSRTEPNATGSVTIQATPAQAFGLIADPPAMARFTAETYAAQWLDGVSDAAIGARFRGQNRNAWRRWVTICEITQLERDSHIAYNVDIPYLGIPISRWRYDIEPAADGCVVTERAWLRIPVWFIPIALLITGIVNRPAANSEHIGTTLERVKAHLESA